MTIYKLKNLVMALEENSQLRRECSLLISELDDKAIVTSVEPSLQSISKDLANIYRTREKHLASRHIRHGAVSLAAEFFEKNIGLEVQLYQIKTPRFGGYAFTNAEQNKLLAFPYAESLEK